MIKQEFETATMDHGMLRVQKDEYEQKRVSSPVVSDDPKRC